MKKIVLVFSVISCMLITAPNLFAVDGRGHSQTRTEDSRCASGVARFCGGDGDLCELTNGWDCEIKPTVGG